MPRPDIERITHYAAQVVACNEVLRLPMPDWKMKRRATLLTLAKQDVPALLAYIAELESTARWRDAKTEPPVGEFVPPQFEAVCYSDNGALRWVDVCRYDSHNNCWFGEDHFVRHVTHWRPLPEPPEAHA